MKTKIRRAKLKFNLIDKKEELDDVLQDLIDFSMSTSSNVDAVMDGRVGLSLNENVIDKQFENIDRLKRKLLKMYKMSK